MILINLYAIYVLLAHFTASSSGYGCYTSGYKFSDLLEENNLNSTITEFCQNYEGKQFKNGETVKIPNSCIETRKNNEPSHIDVQVTFTITDKSGQANLTLEACKDILFQTTKKCQQGTRGVIVTYGYQQASARSLRNARGRPGEGDSDDDGDSAGGDQQDGRHEGSYYVTVTTWEYTTEISTTFVPPPPPTQTVFDTTTRTERETVGITVTTRLTSSAISHSRSSSASSHSTSISSTSTSSSAMNTAFTALVKLDPNEDSCSGD